MIEVNDVVDLKLLRKAWPEGRVLRRGVYTVGHWQCVHITLPDSEGPYYEIWRFSTDSEIQFCENKWSTRGEAGTIPKTRLYADGPFPVETFCEEGDLLPNVDPNDTATWACLLQEMAEACGMIEPGKRRVSKLQVSQFSWVRELNGVWYLGAWTSDIRDKDSGSLPLRAFRGLDAEDPAMALVLARIQVRKELGR